MYISNFWQDGDVITANKLNNIEAGIKNNEESINNKTTNLQNEFTGLSTRFQNEINILKEQIPLDLQSTLNDILSRVSDLEKSVSTNEIISSGLVVNITNNLTGNTVIDNTTGEAYKTNLTSYSSEGLEFNNNYLELPAEKIDLSSDFTIQIKHKFSKLTSWSKLFSNETSSASNVFAFGISSTNYMAYCTNSTGGKVIESDLPLAPVVDKFYTVSIVKTGTNINVYIDENKLFSNSNVTGVSSSAGKWYLGRNGANFNGYFSGTMSRVLVYNKALSESEIFGNLRFL